MILIETVASCQGDRGNSKYQGENKVESDID